MDINNVVMFRIVSLEKQKIISYDESYIELFENYFRYVAKYESEEENTADSSLPWEFNKIDLDIYVLRSSIASIEKSFRQKLDKWQIYISVVGKQEDIWIFFEEKEECEEVFDKLINYFINGIKD